MSEHNATSTASVQHRCSECLTVFRNVNHLRRHEESHTKVSSYRCQFCSRSFVRNDALRRHFKTCSKIEQQDAIPVAKRGRRSRACERCRSKKLRCDGAQPCRRCSFSQIECSFSIRNDGDDGVYRVPMTFMLNYTNPALESVSDAFGISEAHAELSVKYAASFNQHASFLHDDFMADLFSGISSDPHGDQQMECIDQTQPVIMITPAPIVEQRAAALVALLKAQHDSTPTASLFPASNFPVKLAESTFLGNNLAEYISAFFHYFHPHTPFIHRPSFDVSKVSLHLLLAVVLLGSIFCTPQDDALSARGFFGLAEEHVFERLREVIVYGESSIEGDTIDILQAAVLVHALQVNINHGGVRLRARVNRFPEIVAAMRRVDLFSAVRMKSSDAPTWEQFIFDEVRIRLSHRVFITDCMNTLFFKSSPQITVAEMCGDLPSTDAMFETANSTEYERLVATPADLGTQGGSLKDLVTLSLGESWSGPDSASSTSVGTEHLMSLIFALHSIIFVSRTGLLLSSTRQILERATNRWKELWQAVDARGHGERPLVGFAKYALELWWLAQKILEVAQSGDVQSSYMTSTPTDSLMELHEFVREYQTSS